MEQPNPPVPAEAPPTCPRHPDRITFLRCQRCGRPACPDCQRPAPVGFHCVDCLREARRTAPVARTAMGGVATDRPLATYVLIGICAVMYLAQQLVPGLTDRLDFTPFFGRTEPWRMLTATFLHAPYSPMHILFNMFALWQVGQFLEPVLGRLRFVALYLTSALGGSVMYLLMAFPPVGRREYVDSTWLIGTVGASGAVFGLFAALLVLSRRLRVSQTGLFVLLAINAVLPFVYRNIAWQAHLGGFVTGLLVAGLFLVTRQRDRVRWQLPAVVALIGLLVGLSAAKYATTDDRYLGIPRSPAGAASPATGPDAAAAGPAAAGPAAVGGRGDVASVRSVGAVLVVSGDPLASGGGAPRSRVAVGITTV